MTGRARQLLQDALTLPTAERAGLAAELVASLDGEPDADVDGAWAEEIERRAREALAHPESGTEWDVVRGRIESTLRRG